MTRRNVYDTGWLDRVSQHRVDAEWIERHLARPESVIVPMWRSRNLVVSGETPRAALLSIAQAAALMTPSTPAVLLGIAGGNAHFAIDLSELDEPHAVLPQGEPAEFTDLRQVGALLDRNEGALLAYARGIVHWHRTHRFCGWCGAATEARHGGHVRRCTNPDCAVDHFPRTDPAIIVVVSNGERALLGRKAEWAKGMYSALAGFVEPGESLEQAVAREVMEEVGVALTGVRYQSSQPWPFPASLMLGFHATTEATTFRPNDSELEDARWFTRQELRDGRNIGFGMRPRSDSIARRLIDEWLEQG